MSVSKARRAELQDELLSTVRRLDALKVELRHTLPLPVTPRGRRRGLTIEVAA